MREAVGEMKGDMLDYVGTFKVGQVAAAMPPGSAILPNGVFLSSGLKDGVRHTASFVDCVFYSANQEIGVPGGGVFRVGH